MLLFVFRTDNTPTFHIYLQVDEFHKYCKPQDKPELSHFCQNLTKITQVIKLLFVLLLPMSNDLNLCHWNPFKQSCALIDVFTK